MRIAVISDIHGNLHALRRVLEEVDAAAADALWCLGDTVGYGPRPNECCEIVDARAALCLSGNHDLLVLGKDVAAADFNPDAAAAGVWTASVLDERSRAFLDRLEPRAVVEGAELFHASARDPVWEYVLSSDAARLTLELTDAPLVLVGHSHVPLAVSLLGETLAGGQATAGSEVVLAGARWLVNPGSVGQPRDGDPRASWLLLDLVAGTASFRRVEYAVTETQREMCEVGLPTALVERLARGL